LFFFSSRRRHTRFSRDWSSDVCSSDLKFHQFYRRRKSDLSSLLVLVPELLPTTASHICPLRQCSKKVRADDKLSLPEFCLRCRRSEERRVGKECRSRRCPDNHRRECQA